MGGSIGEGNTTVSAEFNIYADPEAADVVFRAGIPITMIGLDVTHQALLDRASATALRALGTTSGRIAAELTEFALDRNLEWSGATTTAIHDAVAIAHLALPDLVAVAPYHVVVDTTNGPARGRTVCDGLPYRLRRDSRTPNADVGIVIDRKRFEDLLIDAFGRLP
jgi:inosine-uridine nucleoside N-ribohydrolase